MGAGTQQLPVYTDFILEVFEQYLHFTLLRQTNTVGDVSTTQLLYAPLNHFQLASRRTLVLLH